MWLQWLYNVNCFFLIRNFAFVYYSFSAWSDFWKAGFVKRDIFVHHFYTSQILRVAHLTLKRNISISLLYSSHLFEHRKGSTKRNFTKIADTGEIRGCWKAEFTQHWATEGRWNWKGNTKLRPFGYINLSLADR